jgi:hypothetical protein
LAFEKNVFVNCPFDAGYVDLLRPILFCILALDFEPRISLERADGAESRIDKIVELINDSKYGIHDLSRLKAIAVGEYYRLNMPFELGMDYACRLYGGGQWAEKRILVLEDKRFELKQALSDLSGSDVEPHDNEPVKVCKIVRDWLAQALPADAPSPSSLWARFNEFTAANYEELTKADWSPQDIETQPIRELVKSMRRWLRGEQPGA